MKRFMTLVLLGASLVGFSACSSYPIWVPDWAQVGAEKSTDS